MFILLLLVEVALLVCFIMVLIKQFKEAGPLHGIIGIITCSIWTFIWGWINSGKLDIRSLMLVWTVLILVCFALGYIVGIGMTPYRGLPTNG
ncbi:MAG: hypothetical protein ABR501_10090 [Pyrinomonadaceae bacterium]